MTTLLAILAMVAGPSAKETPKAQAAGCQTQSCHNRVVRKRKQRVVQPFNAKLDRMAQCESTGRWNIATGNDFYGGLQFTLSTWRSVGGQGMPHWSSELEQKFRAVLLIKRSGYGQWPICGGS
jgi:hypothetical protein